MAVAALIDRPGLWRRAAFDGTICGLDLTEALAALPSVLDREFAVALLLVAESAFIPALLNKEK